MTWHVSCFGATAGGVAGSEGERHMSEQHVDPLPESSNAVSGQAARRKFLKKSGSVAIAAPAAMLLLAATSKSALATNGYNGRVDSDLTD